MFITSTDSTARPDRILCMDFEFISFFILHKNSFTFLVFYKNICHRCIFKQRYI